MKQDTPAEETAVADSQLITSENFTELFQAKRLEEYKRIRRISRFIRVKNDLNVALKEIMERMLEAPPSIDNADFEYREISDMSHELPSLE